MTIQATQMTSKRTLGIAKNILKLLSEGNLPLAKKVRAKKDFPGTNAETDSFIISCLSILYGRPFSEKELDESVSDGSGDECLDAIVFNAGNSIDVFDFKIGNENSEKDLSFFFKSVEENVLDIPNDYSIFNTTLTKSLKKVHRYKGKLPVRIFIVRGSGAEETKFFKKRKSQLETLASVLEVRHFSEEDLLRYKFESESYTDHWQIDLNKGGELYHDNLGELIVRLPLQKVVDLFNDCRVKGFDLFNKNVRSFLGAGSYVSEGIVETLNDEPENFYKYHNGLTIAVGKIIKQTNKRFSVTSPQIINGAQTVNSIVNALDLKHLQDITKAYILCKIYVADENQTEKICETSNTQAKVELSDLRSNDDIQFSLKLLIENLPNNSYSYFRKRPFKKGKNNISLPEFTQWIYSALFERPADAKNKKRELFDATKKGLYKGICVENSRLHNVDVIQNLCEIGTFVRQMISKESKTERSLLKSADLHIVAGLYFLNKTPTAASYEKIKRILRAYVAKEKIADPNVSNNKLFTKSEDAWKNLKSQL
ncbi:MAG: AIPR family protein [Minisyncoccota bacterium]